MDFYYRFPVVKGIQSKKEYYIAMVPLKMVPKLFPNDGEYVSPEYRAQRKLNEARVPIIANYILQNRDNYVFSALAASIDGKFRFLPNHENNDTGVLEISMDARFLINDGQHRKAAILAALKEDESLEDETISIVFFEDEGLARSQQIFTDLNKNAVRTSNSISELYDSRDSLAVATRTVVANNDFLNQFTDKEKDILGKFSSNFFTLNTLYTANRIILGKKTACIEDMEFLEMFWDEIVTHIIPWQEVKERSLSKVDVREKYIVTQGIVMQAFGRVGHFFYSNESIPVTDHLVLLERVNWTRNSPEWEGRAINQNGRIITNNRAAILIANYLKTIMRLPLTEEEKEMEKSLKEQINNSRTIL